MLLLTIYNQTFLLKKRFSFSFTNPFCSWCNQEEEELDEVRFIPTNTLLTRMVSPADPDFMADLLWMRASYYFGVHAITDQDFFYLHYLLNKITDLSPRWEYPYLFGAIALYVEAQKPHQALSLLEKGILNLNESWRLRFLKGYIHWKVFKNYELASKTLYRASQIEGAPQYFVNLSVTLAMQSKNSAFSKAFYDIVMQTLKNPFQKKIIQQKIKEEDGIEK